MAVLFWIFLYHFYLKVRGAEPEPGRMSTSIINPPKNMRMTSATDLSWILIWWMVSESASSDLVTVEFQIHSSISSIQKFMSIILQRTCKVVSEKCLVYRVWRANGDITVFIGAKVRIFHFCWSITNLDSSLICSISPHTKNWRFNTLLTPRHNINDFIDLKIVAYHDIVFIQFQTSAKILKIAQNIRFFIIKKFIG